MGMVGAWRRSAREQGGASCCFLCLCQLRGQVNGELSYGGADLAVQLLQWSCGGQMLTLKLYPEMLLVLCLSLFAEASLSRHASQVGLRAVVLLQLIFLGLGPG